MVSVSDLDQLRLAINEGGRPIRPLVTVSLDGADWAQAASAMNALDGKRTPIMVGVATTALPEEASPVLDRLTFTLAPDGPGTSWVSQLSALPAIEATVDHAPTASLTLAGLLRVIHGMSVENALVVESLAYSTLLAGPEFAQWRARTPRKDFPPEPSPVLLERAGSTLFVTLNRPRRHNAFSAAMRDALVDSLEVAAQDPDVTEVLLRGNGASFCSGGDLDEFGTTPDVATAHLVRLSQSAGHAVHRLRHKVRASLHGACIGAGIEVPAFASSVVATPGTFFQLPEVGFGLVPGAGGTVSLSRRIGPWRTAFLALSGHRLDLETALHWGLVDERAS